MSGKTYFVLFMVLILVSMIGGAIFYFFMFIAFIGLAGHWIYNIK